MSARKLQQEMERVFKRVSEGCSSFEVIYTKLMNASNQTQKEKLEQDLKREIKKLQKMRDQIKTWIASNDVRDKNQLVEHRKLIENDMERFKAVEREVKTKAYSREGLMRLNDPYAKEKQETIDFLQQQIELLEQQTQDLEAEEDNLQSTNKRGKKDHSKQERINEIDFRLDRHKFHIQSMETMIDMIDRDKLAPETVNDLQDDIQYYVDSNQEVDFAEDEQIYEELNLEAEEEGELLETIVRDDTYTLEDLAQDLSKEAAKEAKEKGKKDKPSEKSVEKGVEKSSDESVEKSVEKSSDTRPSTPLRPQSSTNSITQSPEKEPSGINPLPPPSVPASKQVSEPKKGAHLAQGGATAFVKKDTNKAQSPLTQTPLAQTPLITPKASMGNMQAAGTTVGGTVGAGVGISGGTGGSTGGSIFGTPSSVHITPAQLPPQLHTTATQLDQIKQRLQSRSISTEDVRKSYLCAPDSSISNKPQYYHPQNPYPTPEYYPQHPLKQLFDEQIFSEMHVDTLFYVFYYCQGTHQQYLAAQELKRRTWRFHKQFLTWFQRQEDPKVLTNEYEEGTYRFFDFEGSWVQRRKQDFKFEFKYLE